MKEQELYLIRRPGWERYPRFNYYFDKVTCAIFGEKRGRVIRNPRKILFIRNDHIGDLILSSAIFREIKKKIHERDEEMKNVLVLGNPEWKPSLLGLVANSFSDEHNRPVFLWGREGSNGSTIIKGSCRSGGDVDIVKLMEKAKDVFLEYGGHKGAGGFSVSQENIHTLEEKLNEAFLKLKQNLLN